VLPAHTARLGRIFRSPWPFLIAVALVALIAYLFYVALHLRVDYYDSYEAFWDARLILHRDGGVYLFNRAFLTPGAIAALLKVGTLLNMPELGFVGAHVVAVLVLGLALLTCYRFFRLYLKPLAAQLAVLLMALNPITIHQAPVAKEDILSMLLLAGAFYFYLLERRSARVWQLVVSGILVGVAMTLRVSLVPVPLGVVVAYEVVHAYVGGRTRWKILPGVRRVGRAHLAALVLLPSLIFFVTAGYFYLQLRLSSFWHGWISYIGVLQRIVGNNSVGLARPWLDFRFIHYILESATLPVVGLAVAGIVWSVWRRLPGTLFNLVWLVFVFVQLQVLVPIKEARYLLPVFPPFYFFAGRALAAAPDALVRMHSALKKERIVGRLATAVVVAGLLALPAYGAVRESAKWTDHFYSADYEREVVAYAQSIAGTHAVRWAGVLYPLHPADYVFDRDDPFTYIYHFWFNAAEFWSDRKIPSVAISSAAPDATAPYLRVGPDVARSVEDGDALVINPYRESFTTWNVPQHLDPIVVQRVRMLSLAFVEPDLYRAVSGETLSFTYNPAGPSIRVRASGLSDTSYELYADTPEGPISLGYLRPNAGNIAADISTDRLTGLPGSLRLLSYDSGRAFPAPD
jgi:hypothetical protein